MQRGKSVAPLPNTRRPNDRIHQRQLLFLLTDRVFLVTVKKNKLARRHNIDCPRMGLELNQIG